MEVAGTNIPSLWDKHPGVLGDAKLFMVRTLLNKRHTLHFRCDSRKKTVPPYFHIHVPMYIYIYVYMNKIEDYDNVMVDMFIN
jgi:hypothetical protein